MKIGFIQKLTAFLPKVYVSAQFRYLFENYELRGCPFF